MLGASRYGVAHGGTELFRPGSSRIEALRVRLRAYVLYGLLLVAGLCASAVSAQEICNNALDDDADGLVDLNDTTDCVCIGSISDDVSSFIPNPSFELYDSVPDNYAQLSRAVPWEQATNSTTDFLLNVNGGFWLPGIPQPLPDGIGLAGFIPYEFLADTLTTYLEYMGACLNSPMQAGVQYTLEMDVAGALFTIFNDSNATYPATLPFGDIDITIFGSASCPVWPVQLPPPPNQCGCPIGVGDWVELGSVTYSPDGQWQTVTINFTPLTDIRSVMIGGPCDLPDDYFFSFADNAAGAIPYFLADDLVLNTSEAFATAITASGGFCTDDLVLHASSDSIATEFQWYLNGVALIGETDSILQVGANGLPAGTYQFRSSVNDTACVTSALTITKPVGPDVLAEVAPASGCPQLAVQFTNATAAPVVSCSWSFGDGTSAATFDPAHVYTGPGVFDVTLTVTLQNGCTYDSTYQDLVTVFAPPVAAFSADPQPAIIGNTEVSFTDQSSGGISAWAWDFDSIPPFTSTDSDPTVTFPAVPGEYPVVLVVENAAGCSDTVRSIIRVEPSGEITLPNVFTPNGDGVNDRFLPLEDYPGQGRLTVLNRWGQEVFTTASVTSGWSGADAPDGTYFWTLEALEDRGNPLRSGYVTLLRGR